MKNTLMAFGCILVFLLVGCSGCSEKKEKTDGIDLVYVNNAYGIGFDPPENWTVYQGINRSLAIIAYDHNGEAILALFKPIEIMANKSFDEAIALELIGYPSKLKNFSLISTDKVIINGNNAIEFVFTYEKDTTIGSTAYSGIVQERHIYFEHERLAYLFGSVIKPEKYTEYADVVNQSIQTVTFL